MSIAIGIRIRASIITAVAGVLLDEEEDPGHIKERFPLDHNRALVHPLVEVGLPPGLMQPYPGWLRAVIESSPFAEFEGSAMIAALEGLEV